jgi:hypothetical protein
MDERLRLALAWRKHDDRCPRDGCFFPEQKKTFEQTLSLDGSCWVLLDFD